MNKWYTLSEACEYVGLKERTVRKLVKEGKLRYSKPSMKLLFQKRWLDAYVMNMGTRLTPTQKRELEDLS